MTDIQKSEVGNPERANEARALSTGVLKPTHNDLEVCVVNDDFVACETTAIVDVSTPPEVMSPIDQFIKTTQLLNVLLVSRQATSDPSISGSMLLSDVSPQELRALEAIEDESTEDANPSDDALLINAHTTEAAEFSEVNEINTQQTLPDAAQENLPDIDRGASAPAQNAIEDLRSASIPTKAELDYQLNGLVLLGFVSAVESYLRGLTTRLVWVDEFVAKKAEDQKLPYGAARYHTPELLAEAFMEEMTLIAKDSVTALLRDIVGVRIQSDKFDLYLAEYDRICQLRHCIVHRFGKLGSKNAIKLGLREHSGLLEKPIKISVTELEKISRNLLSFVQVTNNVIYDGVMRRQGTSCRDWQWSQELDFPKFSALYEIFQSHESTYPSAEIGKAYDDFKTQCEFFSVRNVEKQKARKEQKARRTAQQAREAELSILQPVVLGPNDEPPQTRG